MGVACVQAAPVVAPDAALPAESSGLKISISPTFTSDNSDSSIALHHNDPHINVVLQNTSDKPIRVYQDWNSWGYYNLTLQITSVDGKKLDKPLNIGRGPGMWLANTASTDIIEAGQAMVREVRLNLPPEVFAPKPQFSEQDTDAKSPLSFHSPNSRFSFSIPKFGLSFGANSNIYFGFPFPPPDNSRTLTVRALFSNDDAKGTGGKDTKQIWTGNIASPLKDYRVFWDAD